MGYLVPEKREYTVINSIEEYIKENWGKVYDPRTQRAFTNTNQFIWYKYLQYQKDRGWIKDFRPLSKQIKYIGRVSTSQYKFIYYPDFEVQTKFGDVMYELMWGKVSKTFFNFIKENQLLVVFVDKYMIKSVKENFSDVIDFIKSPLEVKDIDSKKYYKHV